MHLPPGQDHSRFWPHEDGLLFSMLLRFDRQAAARKIRRYAVTTYGLAPTQPPCSAATRYMRIILPAADRHSHDNVTLWRIMSPDGGSLIQRRLRRHGVGESCLVVRMHDPPWSV
jgi:hypothetical protein